MQLKLQRSQREGGVISRNVIFCLDARVHLTAEEQANVNRYKMGGQVIYNSQAARKHLDNANVAGAQGSYWKSLASVALAALNLNITIDGLQRGQHIECKDLDELLSAEEALMEACQRLKLYLETAATFDGRETVIDFSQAGPTLAVNPNQPALIPPARAAVAAPTPTPLPREPASAYVSASASTSSSTTDSYSFPNTADNPFEPLLRWWNGLAPRARTWIAIGGGLLLLIILLKL